MKYFINCCLLLITIHTYGQRVIKNCNSYALADFEDSTFNSEGDFNGAIFESKADFDYTKFNWGADFYGAIFESQAYFRFTKFDSLANFMEAGFEFEAIFSGATFNSEAYFNDVTFNSMAFFSGATFNSEAFFSNATFESKAFFNGATFIFDAFFNSATFDSLARFNTATFNSKADFTVATFISQAEFFNTTFDSLARFNGATFNSLARFKRSTFNSKADFSQATFNTTVNFTGVTFMDEIDFTFSILPDTLYLTDVKTEKTIDFSSAENKIDTSGSIESENVCVLFIARTDLSKIRLNYANFQLPFYEDSLSKKGIANIYENLLLTQKEFPEGYKKLDIEYKEYKYMQKGLLGRIYNFLDKCWWNYGYNKEMVVYNTFFIVIIFSLINWFLFECLNQKVYKIEKVWNNYLERRLDLKRRGIKSRAIRMINILPYSFYYTSLIFFGFKMNTDKINYKNHIGLFYLVLLYVIGIIDLLFIANFVFTG